MRPSLPLKRKAVGGQQIERRPIGRRHWRVAEFGDSKDPGLVRLIKSHRERARPRWIYSSSPHRPLARSRNAVRRTTARPSQVY